MFKSRIKKLKDLLSEYIGEDREIIHVEEIDFLGKGENYGSVMFRVDVTVKNKFTEDEELIQMVAKMIPEMEERRQMFNVQKTVVREIVFYNKIVPLLQNFIKESNVEEDFNMFPKLYGARLNLNGSDVVDEDSVILLENLIVSGFKNADRHEGFDYETAKMILKDLAVFHSVAVALRLKKPHTFESEIKPLCEFSFMETSMPSPPPGSEPPHMVILKLLSKNEKCLPYVDKLKEKFDTMPKKFEYAPPREPWASITHLDLWVNNLMIKYRNGAPLENKFVDFQVYNYNECIRDVFFLLWTSVKRTVLENHLDDLMEYYHRIFVEVLEKFECNTDQFTYKSFLDEMERIAKDEIIHVVFFIMIIFGKKGEEGFDPGRDSSEVIEKLHPEGKEKCWYMVQEWGRRGWF